MNDPTHWSNDDPETGSFEFKSIEEADRAVIVMNRLLREAFKNGRNVAYEEAATTCEGERTHHPHRDNQRQDTVLTLMAEKIRALKQGDAASPGPARRNNDSVNELWTRC